ncbi:MAG TPA: hypothetical protein VI749_01860 [Candidatus Omnitrophota bacterium]|nr:hypothetical protein [Candidatus Omnitrophota bacterium]
MLATMITIKRKHTGILPIALILGVFAFNVFCCCLPKVAQAATEQPSCHQTNHESKSKDTQHQDCDCVKQPIVIEKQASFNAGLSANDFFVLLLASSISFDSNTANNAFSLYHAPPGKDTSSLPLYLKNSNLRL